MRNIEALTDVMADEIGLRRFAYAVQEKIAEQEATIKALREDAERYHWLRDNGGYFALPTNQLKHKDGKWLWEELLDAVRKK